MICIYSLYVTLALDLIIEDAKHGRETLACSFTVDGIADFLNKIKMPQYVDAFKAEEVDGEMLLEANSEMLGDLGVSPLHQIKIMQLFHRELNKGK